MNILITAGPTVEPIDDVRCITNFSSGKTGIAIATALKARGHSVRLVAGPIVQQVPQDIETINVRSTEDMRGTLTENFPWCDALVMAAAVCDFRPAGKYNGKIPRKEGFTLELVPNPDLLAEVASTSENKVIMGFALERKDGIQRAAQKCASKHCDVIALNSPASLGSDDTGITLVYRNGQVKPFPVTTKKIAGELIAETLEELYSALV